MAQGLLDEADGRAEVKALAGWLACANAAAGTAADYSRGRQLSWV